jgi:hypothetical protein
MTKKKPETLAAICNTIASGVTSYSAAAKLNDVSPDSLWLWVKRSQVGDDPALIIEYLGETVPFHTAVHAARRIALHEMRGRMEQKSILGYDEPIFYNGMPTWKPDPRCVGWSEEDRLACGFRADGLYEDKKGRLVQNAVHHEPPVALQLRVAEMAFPKEYRPGVNQTVETTHNVKGIQHAKPLNYADGPPPVPAPPTPPLLEAPADDATANAEDDFSDILGPELEAEPEEHVQPTADAPHADIERVIRDTPPKDFVAPPTAKPVGYSEVPLRAPRNELEADLFAKLEAARNKPRP